MMQLNAPQTQALQAIKMRRDLRQLSQTLAGAFPDVPARLGERYDALIAHGVQRGAALGLDHAVCVARYLACWFVLGAEFEAKPEFAWAQDILASSGRPQGSRIFQLTRRTREELGRRGESAGGMKPSVFDEAIAVLDETLMPRGTLGSLLPPVTIQLGEPCDIDALDLRLVEPAPGKLAHQYRYEQTQWRRLPAQVVRPPLTFTVSEVPRQPPVSIPARLYILGQPAGRDPTVLRVRTRAAYCCDPQVHPLVGFNGSQGLSQWRGMHAADVSLHLYVESPQAVGDELSPSIGVQGTPQYSLLTIGACGTRASGAPMGDQHTQLAAYPSEQHLLVWRREHGPAMEWPEPSGGQPQASSARCRVERDGLPLEAMRWQAGLEDLDRQLAEGLSRLATAWERESGVSRGRLQAEPAVMSGTTGLTWGWCESASGMSEAPFFRLAAAIELTVCQLNLQFAGDFSWQGSQSRLSLHCAAQELMNIQFDRRDATTELMALVKPAEIEFRQPFVIHLEPLAMADQAALLSVAGPVGGAVVGKAGLRQRKEGQGLQWFCQLSIEAVSVALHLHDPLLGEESFVRPLLPSMKLLDWSVG